MSTEPEPAALTDDPFMQVGVQYYLFAGVSGLLAAWALLLERFGIFSVIPLLLGGLGMATYAIPPRLTRLWKALKRPNYRMPLFVILSIVALIFVFPTSSRGNALTFDIEDLLLAASLLTYLASQYRMFSLGTAAFPPDMRPTPRAETGDAPEARPESSVGPRELLWLGATLLASLLLGFLMWRMTVVERPGIGLSARGFRPVDTPWRYAMLFWLIGTGVLLLRGFFHTLRAYRSKVAEARMVLQDALWAETRGEQRRINRWIAWQKRRHARRKEKDA